MERVKQVLDERAGEIAAHLMLRQDLDRAVAERFVELASAELIASWEWQASSLQLESLPTWTNVQRLLGGIHAKALASDLDLPPDQVWYALRTFVPRVLILANGSGQPAEDRGTAPSRRTERRGRVDRSAGARGVAPGWPLLGPSPTVSPG